MISVGSARVVPHFGRVQKTQTVANNPYNSYADKVKEEKKLPDRQDAELKSELTHERVLNILLTKRKEVSAKANSATLLEMIMVPPSESQLSWYVTLLCDFFEDVSLLLEPCLSLMQSQQSDVSIEKKPSYSQNIVTLLFHIEKQLKILDEFCPLSSGIDFDTFKDLEIAIDSVTEDSDRVSSKEEKEDAFSEVNSDIQDESLVQTQSKLLVHDVVTVLFRLYAVLYRTHSQLLEDLDLLDLLNVSSRRFMLFLLQFKLLPAKDILCFVVNFRS